MPEQHSGILTPSPLVRCWPLADIQRERLCAGRSHTCEPHSERKSALYGFHDGYAAAYDVLNDGDIRFNRGETVREYRGHDVRG